LNVTTVAFRSAAEAANVKLAKTTTIVGWINRMVCFLA